jgi:hypothetical protein
MYNVLIGGFSIGLTASMIEAENWIASSGFGGKKVIVKMK